MMAGDSMAQTIEISSGQIQSRSAARTAVMGSWAFCGDAPLNILLFRAVDRLVGAMGIPPQASLALSVVKAVMFFAPGSVVRNPLFLTYVTAAEHGVNNWREGRPITTDSWACKELIQEKMSNDLGNILSNSACVWIPGNTFTFYCVSPPLRAVSNSLLATVWLTYLSLMQHKPRSDA
jgi:hypothetical protein